MKIKQFVIIFSLFVTIQGIAQYYTPQSPILIPKSGLDKSSIVQTLNSERVLFKPIDIDELRLAIRKSNNSVENEISLIKSKMSNLFMDKQELMQLKDIKKINEVIAEKKKNKNEIEEQVQTDLTSINYKGLFIVVQKKIDPWASKQQLADLSEKALTPKAVEDLNGVFVSSMTTIESSQLISDRIIATISGEMSVEKQFISRTIDNRTKFLYLVKVNVTPLKKTIKTSSAVTAASETHLIVNAMTEKEYETKLQSFGVSQDEISKVVFEVQSTQESIQLANATAGRRQADILKNGNANINKIDDEIKTLENSLTNRSGILKKIIEEKTNVVYDPGNSDKSIENALSFLDSELDALKNQLISTKERELILRYNVSVTAEGIPAEDVAKTAIDIAGQIEQSHSKIEQFMEETTVDNFMLTDLSRGQQKDVYRKLESVWLYPVTGDRDNFLLTVVVKFKVADIKEHKVESKPIRKEIDTSDTMTDIDGNVYKTVKIGNQVWMAENLKVTHYRNGDPIPIVTDNSEWAKLKIGAYCAYENNADYSDTYGYLYNWYTVNDSRNIAPEGWHVPSDEEWMELEIYLGMSQSDANSQGIRGTNVGGKLKKANTNLWEYPNKGATNESGFSAIAGGFRLAVEGTFEEMGRIATFWSSTEAGPDFIWLRGLKHINPYPFRSLNNHEMGNSIRLVKD
ncbi:MAG: fibrobacter succinogenes major paralogous domain-containing protein [Chitinivibrionales bacterium]|nr:fibrobacter succinogenes major paralogous domain-containing protein [Chitinivibrionales bacterium]